MGNVAGKILSKRIQHSLFSSETENLTLKEVSECFQKISECAGGGSQDKKMQLMYKILSKATETEAKFFIRLLLGEMRIGIGEGVIKDAIAGAFFAEILWKDLLWQKVEEGEDKYLFSWDNVLGNDNRELLGFLRNNLKIEWVENAEIKKNNNNQIITITNGENSLRLKLNEEENKVMLELIDGKTYSYILKRDGGILNIYRKDDRILIQELLEKIKSKKILIDSELENTIKKDEKLFDYYTDFSKNNYIKIKKLEYLFNWEDIPENNAELIKFLKGDLKIEWIENAKIEKSDDGKVITITKGEKLLIFKLDEEEKKIILEVRGGEKQEYILKKDRVDLKIYKIEKIHTEDIESFNKILLSDTSLGKKLKTSITTNIEVAYNLTSDMGKIAKIAKLKGIKGLENIVPEIGIPIRVMLAQKLGPELFNWEDIPEHLFIWNEIREKDSKRFITFLEKNLELEWIKNAEIKRIDENTMVVKDNENSLTLILNKEKNIVDIDLGENKKYKYLLKENAEYLFSWGDVSGLLKHLKDDLKINWAENAEIKKGDNDETITFTKESNSLLFKINKLKNTANLEIGFGDTYEYILKEEGSNLNIYKYNWYVCILGKDGKKFLTFLEKNLELEWIKNAEIKRIYENKLLIKDNENSLAILLNEEKNIVDVELGGEKIYEYNLEKENGNLNISINPIENAIDEFGRCAFEVKYDGMRIQIQKNKDKIYLFTRRLENVTTQFPEIVRAVKENVQADSVIMEGETVAIQGIGQGDECERRKPRVFQELSRRIKRKYDIEEIANKIPIEINLFDILYLNGKSLMNEKFENRRKILENTVRTTDVFRLAEQTITDSVEEAEKFYNYALKLGHEGVMAKKLDSVYQAGSRVGHMYKIKQIMETLDVVIVGGTWGEGKRAQWLASFLLAVRDPVSNKFLTIGRLGTGFTDEQFKEMTEKLKELITQEEGKEVEIKPNIVVEVAYEEIQKSPSYTSGYALRFPRLVRFRDDKSTEEADTVERVVELSEQAVG
ncbi:putative DNA ligase (ATP) [groundwater metagenome]|uniref:Putative DNA ligase (ATP) n=1 Tax=groundwater metagenome TaxID=717931 RepID=A0A098EB00_9ZZZZ